MWPARPPTAAPVRHPLASAGDALAIMRPHAAVARIALNIRFMLIPPAAKGVLAALLSEVGSVAVHPVAGSWQKNDLARSCTTATGISADRVFFDRFGS